MGKACKDCVYYRSFFDWKNERKYMICQTLVSSSTTIDIILNHWIRDAVDSV